MAQPKAITPKWWKEGVIYQVYPASFNDTNGDGWGDVKGMTAKLDYLKDLGIDILWSSPIHDSPQVDMGYDISDYKKIYPPYGTLEDVDELTRELKKRDMRLVMDLVVNHTSDQHGWFKESRSSKDNPKRDWYIWKKPKFDADGNRQPPNNWASILGEGISAWVYDETTEEYFLALFTPEQPDLNWETPALREAVHDVLRFWLDRGASGFRMDVINHISKVQTFPDAEIVTPNHPYQPAHKFYANGPRLHEFLDEIKREVLDKYDTMTVGEAPYVYDESEMLELVQSERGYLSMLFVFEHVEIDSGRGGDVPGDTRFNVGPWDVEKFRGIVSKWQRVMLEGGGWNSLYFGNHDQPRSVSHFCDDSDEHRIAGAKLISLLQATLSGTIYVYQGEELGLRNIPLEWIPEELKDVEAVNYWKALHKAFPDDKARHEQGRRGLQVKARDHGRIPMQWDGSPNAGFCPADVQPWMRVNDDYKTVNAERQLQQTGESGSEISVYHFYRKALKMRKEHKDVLVYGNFELLNEHHPDVFAYKRTAQSGESWASVLNWTGKEVKWELPSGVEVAAWKLSNYTGASLDGRVVDNSVTLRPWEGLLGKLA